MADEVPDELKRFLERWNLTMEDVEEVKRQKVVMKQSFGGSRYLLCFDEKRNTVDLYKLVDYVLLKR